MIKSRYPNFSERISIRVGMIFSKAPLSPNAWTLFSLLPAILGFYYLVFAKSLVYGALLFLLAGFVDMIDGGVARVTRSVSNLGAYLDGVIDRIVEAALFFGLMLYGIPDYVLPGYMWAALALFFGSAMTAFVEVYADYRYAISDTRTLAKMGGLLERMERITLVFAGMLAGYFVAPIYLTYTLALVSVLAILTVLQRIVFVVRNAD
ncbi:Archaetidylinositol phosphate synthase [uncultured archaeon]|nr:Archaetidylinositol phosphate synthase [uncultured archaeon]